MARYKVYIASLMIVVMQLTTTHVAYASTTVGGWSIGSAVAQGATTVFTAVKNGATAVAKIRPTPEQVARGALRGAMGGLLLTVAEKLIEDGVDFVLDPANNSIRYTKNVDYTYLAWSGNSVDKPSFFGYGTTKDSACTAFYQFIVSKGISVSNSKLDVQGDACVSGSNIYAFISSVKKKGQETSSIPLTTVASQIISDADSNDKQSQALTTAVAQTATATNTDDQIVPAAQLAQALDIAGTGTASDPFTSPSTPVTGDGTKDNPYTNTKPQDQSQTDNPVSAPTASPMPAKDVPTDCSFFNTACVWFDWTKTQYNTAKTAITDTQTAITEYFKTDSSEKDTVDIDQQKDQNIDTNINFNGSCPPDFVLYQGDFLGISIDWKIEFSAFCTILTSYVRPVVILVGSYLSILIIGGRKDG